MDVFKCNVPTAQYTTNTGAVVLVGEDELIVDAVDILIDVTRAGENGKLIKEKVPRFGFEIYKGALPGDSSESQMVNQQIDENTKFLNEMKDEMERMKLELKEKNRQIDILSDAVRKDPKASKKIDKEFGAEVGL